MGYSHQNLVRVISLAPIELPLLLGGGVAGSKGSLGSEGPSKGAKVGEGGVGSGGVTSYGLELLLYRSYPSSIELSKSKRSL